MMISMPMGLVRLPSSNSCVMNMMMKITSSSSSGSGSGSSQPPKHHNNNIDITLRQQQQQQDFVRPLANFPDRIPGDRFTSFTLKDQKVYEGYTKEIEPLKEGALKMLLKECKAVDKLYLIDIIERLGISYHFEDEIEQQIELLFNQHGPTTTTTNAAEYSDLSTVALKFRLFRQHGYPISSDVFEQFTNRNGEFKRSLESDVKGLLNLYEAAYVRTRKDIILDEALTFTTNSLQQMMTISESSQPDYNYMEKLVKHALYQSIHRGNPRVEAHHFITAYEENEDRNMSLLKMAKLDFNSLQLLYRKELSTLLRWWKEFDSVTKIPYARNRLIECYFYAVVILFEPKYSAGRIAITKIAATGVFIDDTYDAYGTIDELEVFTDAMQRWDVVGGADRLPKHMKNAYNAFMKAHLEVEQHATQVGRPYAFHYIKETWKEYARTSLIQSRWFLSKDEEKLPSFDQYMVNGLPSSAGKLTTFAYSIAMESATEDVLEWFFNDPPILNAANTIFRLINDVNGHQFEKERGAFTPIDIYMEFNVSEREAKRRMMEMAEDAYKDFNEECCRKKKKIMPLTREILLFLKALTFHMDVFYKNGVDGWTDPENAVKPFINRMFMVPFTI